jgi:predicted Fe-Mo cluster-binding NifX family protein
MAIRVALASRDGVVVHQHFGKATHFQIYDIEDGASRFVEVRENTPTCSANGEEAHIRVLSLLSDCQAVVVSRIGPGASAA